MSRVRAALAALALAALAACDQAGPPLVVGSKTFAESRILGEIFAGAAEQAGIPVVRRIGFGTTEINLEGLKTGSIDIYPEYNGTGLVLLGQPPISDGAEAFARVRELYAPLGLTWGPALGFANDYALAMRPDQVEELGITDISDLARQADTLTIGIEDDFLTRPLDGFDALLNRYGMSFGDAEILPLDDRRQLYELLLDGSVDVIEVYATDGQLADFNLTVLEDDLRFFPVYEAAPLLRTAALSTHPALDGVLDDLAGKLDVTMMRELNNRVEVLGEDPADVARSALVQLGIPRRRGARRCRAAAGSGGLALLGRRRRGRDRAPRHPAGLSGAHVEIMPSADPFAEIDNGNARLALVGAPAFFEGGAATPRPGFEAVGAVGETSVHVLALEEGVGSLADAEVIATGPEGSVSYRTTSALAEGLGLDVRIVPVAGEDARQLAEAVAANDADAAVIVQPLGNDTITALLASGARLIPLDGWAEGNNLIRYPYLRPARLPANAYSGQARPIETLSAQLVLAGPAATEELAVGDQGPGASFIPRALPLSPDTVRAISGALPGVEGIDPVLPQSAALRPELPSPPASINPAFDISILSVVVLVMLTWMSWLLFRPERR